MALILIDVALAVTGGVVAFFLSWPFWRDFGYWAESRVMWWVYFLVGYMLAVYTFFIFLRCLRTLFLHDALVKSGYYAKAKSAEDDGKEGAQ